MRPQEGPAVARSVLFLVAGQVATAAISFGVTALLARHLGAGDYGIFFLAATLVQTAFVLVDLGQEYYLVRRIAVQPDDTRTLLGTGGALRLVVALATFPLLAGLAALLGYPDATRHAIALTVVVFGVGSIGDGVHLVLRGLERMDLEAALRVASKLAIGVATVVAVLAGGRLEAILGMQIVGSVAVVPVYYLALRRLRLTPPRLSLAATRSIVTGGAPFLLWALLVNAQPAVSALLLSVLAPPDVMGWYAAAFRLIGLLIFPATLVGVALYPPLSRLQVQSAARYHDLVASSLRATVLLGVLSAAGSYLFADAGVALVYGAGFDAAAGNLRVFAAYLPVVFVDITLGAAIMAAGGQRAWIFAKFAALLVATGGGLVLIPLTQSGYGNGGLGCAAATVVSEGVMLAAALALVPGVAAGLARDLARATAAALSMAAVAWLLRSTPLWVGASAAVSAYLATLVLLGAVRREDLRFLVDVMRLRPPA